MLDETKYPHFIPDKPQGEDVFEGKSQERLAACICDYIRSIDVKPDKVDGVNIPRIIGIEGGWGCGKSNVVRMIGTTLDKEGYYSFTYDAWGHQEDLQRRSILEVLTGELIREKVLTDKVEIQMRNGKTHNAPWKDQLSLLLSNKTTTIRKSTPKLTIAAFWGIGIVISFAICSLVAGQLIENASDFKCYWWIDAIPIGLAFCVALGYWVKDGCFEHIFRMVDYTNNDTIDEEYTSSEEPSVAEFKNWMKAISNNLAQSKNPYKKIVIVFDNMDRLPSDKVMQLWSSIYTFFAGGEFENIWTIIPYDYEHLCQAIYGRLEEGNQVENNVERIKLFISKTFPITYHVPQPVITDYKKLFYTYFDKAFDENEHDREHICQVFMCLKKNPNPRTVITFVNELVSLRMQWSDTNKYRLQNLALFLLKKDYLFYNEGGNENATLEFNLLSNDLYKNIAHFYPDPDGNIRRQICQFAYGLDDEKLAGELPLRLELQRLFSEGRSIRELAFQPNFVTVLESVLSETSESNLDNIVKSMLTLDDLDFGYEQSSIQSKWDMLANYKAMSSYTKHIYDETLDILVKHSTEKRVKDLTRSFCVAMHKIKIERGDKFYEALFALKTTLKSVNSKINFYDYVIKTETTPEHFVEFLDKADKDYKKYKLIVNNQDINGFLFENAVGGSEISAKVFEQIQKDDDYSFDFLKENLSKKILSDEINDDIRPAAYINRMLDSEEGIIENRFDTVRVSTFVKSIKEPWNEKSILGSEDVLAMFLADGNDLSEVDDTILFRLSECIEKYINSDKLLTYRGTPGTAFNKINAYMIKNKKGKNLDIAYFAKNIMKISVDLGVDIKTILEYGNDWEYEDIKELTNSNVREYIHQNLFADYLANAGDFTNGLIKQGVHIMESQDAGFLSKTTPLSNNSRLYQLSVDPYWKQFVLNFVGSDFIPKLNDLLTKELVTMLKQVVGSNKLEDQELLNFLLGHKPVASIMSECLNDVMNNHFINTDVSVLQFKVFGKLLPKLTPDMDTNTARNLAIHFIKPIYKDKECAQIIVENRDFYLEILKKDTSAVQEIIKGILDDPETLELYKLIKGKISKMIINDELKNETLERDKFK